MEQKHVLWVSFGIVSGLSTNNESLRGGIHCIGKHYPLCSEFSSSAVGVQLGNTTGRLLSSCMELKYSQIFAIFGCQFPLVYQELMIYCK